MTAVEFYDRAPIENVISSLTTAPNKIIFIGDSDALAESIQVYKTFIAKRSLPITIDYRAIDKSDINNIVKVLSRIVEKEQDCVFDLTGGDDLVLVAMGIVYQKYSHKNIKMQRFDFNESYIVDCDYDGNVLYEGVPEISVAENIELHGGAIRYKKDGKTLTPQWDLSGDFIPDVNKMWSICKNDPGLWNKECGVLKEADVFKVDDLKVEFNLNLLKEHLKKVSASYVSIKGFLKLLSDKGLVKGLVIKGEDYSFSYKNEQIKTCLTVAGTVLELKIFTLAVGLKYDSVNPYYNSAMNGVFIDWDGKFHSKNDNERDIENEVDVVLMKGTIPVFISCKNGTIEEIEPYKLDTVASYFGGKYVRKALFATYYGKTKDIASIKRRCDEMGIKFIGGVHKMSDKKLEQIIADLIKVD